MLVNSTVQALHPHPWGTTTDARLDSLQVWQLMIGKGQQSGLTVRKDPAPADIYFQTTLRDKGLLKGPMALALEMPFAAIPACSQPGTVRARQTVRRYLDGLLHEASLIGQLLQQTRTVTHLYWLGDPTYWLSRAELTEVMYRLGQFLHLRRNFCQSAVIEIGHWNRDDGLYALLKGLGFSHLLIDPMQAQPETSTASRLRQYWEYLHLTTIEADALSQVSGSPFEAVVGGPPPDLMVGLGLGAWSVVDHRLTRNTTRLDTYYSRLSENRLPGMEAGTWYRNN